MNEPLTIDITPTWSGMFLALLTVYEHGDAHGRAQALAELRRMAAVADRASALQDFKDYVHQRLDEAEIPTHPEGEHSKAGCRVGDRLDIALAK